MIGYNVSQVIDIPLFPLIKKCILDNGGIQNKPLVVSKIITLIETSLKEKFSDVVLQRDNLYTIVITLSAFSSQEEIDQHVQAVEKIVNEWLSMFGLK